MKSARVMLYLIWKEGGFNPKTFSPLGSASVRIIRFFLPLRTATSHTQGHPSGMSLLLSTSSRAHILSIPSLLSLSLVCTCVFFLQFFRSIQSTTLPPGKPHATLTTLARLPEMRYFDVFSLSLSRFAPPLFPRVDQKIYFN